MVVRVIALVGVLLLQAVTPGMGEARTVSQPARVPTTPAVCAGLTLVLQPGVVDAAGGLKDAAPSDMPLDPVVVEVPLRKGASTSQEALPLPPAIPPILLSQPYFKTAVAEYQLPDALASAVSWYKAKMAACGYVLRSWTTGLNTKTGTKEESYTFESPTIPQLGLRLTFEQSSSGTPLVLYYAWAITLPPRPASSVISQLPNRVQVTYVLPDTKHAWRVPLTSASEIESIVGAFDALKLDEGVHTCFGSRQQATLRIPQGSKTMTVTVVPACYDTYFGTKVRLFDSNHTMWNAVRAAVFSYCLGHRSTKVKA